MEDLDRFYVYGLIDPRDGTLFYVGKGTGDRLHDHTKSARTGRPDSNLLKREKIQAVLAAGLEPFAFIIADGLPETKAVDIEHKLIMGLSGLTNVLAKGWSRSPDELSRISERRQLRIAAHMWRQVRFTRQRRTFATMQAAGLRLGFTWPVSSVFGEKSGKWEDLTEVIADGLSDIERRLLAAGHRLEATHGGT